MDTNEKYALADLVIGHALKSGAQQVSVSIGENRSNNIEIRDRKIDSLKESNQNNLSVSLYVDKKYSAHSTNRMKKDELYFELEKLDDTSSSWKESDYDSSSRFESFGDTRIEIVEDSGVTTYLI